MPVGVTDWSVGPSVPAPDRARRGACFLSTCGIQAPAELGNGHVCCSQGAYVPDEISEQTNTITTSSKSVVQETDAGLKPGRGQE